MHAQPHDSRGFFMLPQSPEGAGYDVYGTPGKGAGQFAHPAMLDMLLHVERHWATIDSRKFGIGNISLAGGVNYKKHRTHKSGLEVDIRPVRRDGAQQPVQWQWREQYDQSATGKLIQLFRNYPGVSKILFNDPGLRYLALPATNHDNHFHVELRG